MKVLSVNLGERKKVIWKGKEIETGIFKYPVDKPIFVNKEHVDDDAVVDRKYHGGEQKALYVYGFNHYEFWQKHYPELEFSHGMFGENITVENLDEHEIKTGDVYKIGEAIIEATIPREPCYKLGIRFDDAKVVKQFFLEDKPGVYFKIIQAGNVQSGDILELVEKAENAKSINEIYFEKRKR
ncbi:MOSC domain-containing protein [Aureivirga sp. CE67]|uniref:MOSC domain-containing protein n=1 Tax=Aureivirga sp. CE67 TaxID=1788983 RepID=UPI0018CB8AB5|nr:MOSC domain-containing protein [Aureivirga sp. CE67]